VCVCVRACVRARARVPMRLLCLFGFLSPIQGLCKLFMLGGVPAPTAWRVLGLVGKSEGKRPLGRPRRRWVDNIRMNLGEVGWGDVDWIGLAKDRNGWRAVVNSVLNLRVT
jgi:hypothetical protein